MTSNDFTPRDQERLLRGDATGPLADAAPAIAALRALNVAPNDAETARAAAALASVAADSSVPLTGPAAATPSPWRMRAAIAGGLALLGLGVVGGAAAADDAAPGDALYGVDRALEDLGIGDGGVDERVDEAIVLDEAGDSEGALEHVVEAVEEDSASSEALLGVAERLRTNGSEASAEVHERVAAMLEWMATTDATGRDFGQGVSERARGLVTEPSTEPSPSASASPAPSASPEPSADTQASGKSGTAGKPETTGKPSTAGKPDTTGTPDNAGKPSTAGKPETAGKPDTVGKP